jgi:hypothetical protein
MVTMRETQQKPFSRSFILNTRHSYQQWCKESGHDLKPLLTFPIDQLLKIIESDMIPLESDEKSVDWSEAALIKSEVLLRVVIRAMTQTSLPIHKHTWSSLFELLLWARSRGSLPHDLSRLSTNFSVVQPSSSEIAESHSKSPTIPLHAAQTVASHPSQFARNAYLSAFGFLGSSLDTNASVKDQFGNKLPTQSNSSGGSWMSLWWSGDDNNDDSDPRKHSPLSLSLIESAFQEDPDRIVSNANAAMFFDDQGQHIRTDDMFLQMSLEKCDLDEHFMSLLNESSQRGDLLFAGVLLTLSKVMERLVHRSFDVLTWTDDNSLETTLFEGSIPLSELFPTYLLDDQQTVGIHAQQELDAVVCLEWVGKFCMSSDRSWSTYGDQLKSKLVCFVYCLPYLLEKKEWSYSFDV